MENPKIIVQKISKKWIVRYIAYYSNNSKIIGFGTSQRKAIKNLRTAIK